MRGLLGKTSGIAGSQLNRTGKEAQGSGIESAIAILTMRDTVDARNPALLQGP